MQASLVNNARIYLLSSNKILIQHTKISLVVPINLLSKLFCYPSRILLTLLKKKQQKHARSLKKIQSLILEPIKSITFP